MDSIGSVEYDGFETSKCNSHVDDHGCKKVVSRKQKPAANGNLDNDEEQAADVEDESNGAGDCDDNENLKPKSDLEIAAAKIDPSHLAASLVEVTKSNARWPDVFKLAGFLDYFGSALSGVPCPWYDMFKESDLLFHVFHLPLSHIPQPVYKTSVDWIIKQIPATVLRGFVMWSFHYILDDMFKGPNGWKEGEEPTQKSKVAIFVALAMILRSKPRALTMILPYLKKDRKFQGHGIIPIRIWMIAQASQDNFCVGLYSWARNLLPLGGNPQSRHLILKFVEKILLEPEARTKLVNAPVWMGMRLIPPPSFEILLRLTFPASSEKVEATRRFEAIYPLLKEVALAGAPKSEEMKQIFTFCLRLAGEENPDLAEEATSIAIWSLTENVDCWKHWDNLYKENLEASVALLKKIVEKCEDHSLKLSSSPSDPLAGEPGSKAMKQVTQQIFTFSLRLAGEENPDLAKEATSIAIWSLTENVDCWKHWDNLYKENLEASVALLKKLVEKCKDHSLKLSSSLSDTLAGEPGSKAMKQVTQQIFTFSLRLAGEGNPVLPKQATAIAIWSLGEIVDCCKRWDNLYTKNLEASVALLKKVVDKWKEHSLKLSSSPSDTLTGAPGSKAMKQVTQQIFTFSLKLAKEGNPVLAKEATAIAIWSLTENLDCWKRWVSLYKENLEASVALLKKLVNEWKDHSLKLSSSLSDTLTVTQAMKIFRLKNKKGITEGGANGSLYKEADKSCKVISGRLSRGSSRLKSASITAVVLVAAGATALVLSSNPEAATELKNLVESLELHLYVNAITRAFNN